MAQLKSKREQKKQERDDRVQAVHRAHPDIADVDARSRRTPSPACAKASAEKRPGSMLPIPSTRRCSPNDENCSLNTAFQRKFMSHSGIVPSARIAVTCAWRALRLPKRPTPRSQFSCQRPAGKISR